MQAEKLHLTNEEVAIKYKHITDLKMEIKTCIQYDSIFDKYIDEICANTVGHITMKLLVANIKAKHPTLPMRIISWKKADQFDPGLDAVFINPKNYDPVTGQAKDALCAIDKSGILVEKYDTLGEALFHELSHAFHHHSGRIKRTSDLLDDVYQGRPEKYLWAYNPEERHGRHAYDEEAYNITGYYLGGFDPISCNMYDICKYASTPESIKQRVFHCSRKNFCANQSKFPEPLHNIDRFLIDLNTYILNKS
jgi:hypothetical protein